MFGLSKNVLPHTMLQIKNISFIILPTNYFELCWSLIQWTAVPVENVPETSCTISLHIQSSRAWGKEMVTRFSSLWMQSFIWPQYGLQWQSGRMALPLFWSATKQHCLWGIFTYVSKAHSFLSPLWAAYRLTPLSTHCSVNINFDYWAKWDVKITCDQLPQKTNTHKKTMSFCN